MAESSSSSSTSTLSSSSSSTLSSSTTSSASTSSTLSSSTQVRDALRMDTILAATNEKAVPLYYEPRGIWLLQQALVQRWTDGELDQVFRREWPNPNMTERQPLQDQQARAGTPMPYCVMDMQSPEIITTQTGHKADSEIQTQRVSVFFRVYAKSTKTVDGKSMAKKMAKYVAFIFDDNPKLDIGPDTHITTWRGPDVSTKHGDREWSWSLQYDYLIDAAYAPRLQ